MCPVPEDKLGFGKPAYDATIYRRKHLPLALKTRRCNWLIVELRAGNSASMCVACVAVSFPSGAGWFLAWGLLTDINSLTSAYNMIVNRHGKHG